MKCAMSSRISILAFDPPSLIAEAIAEECLPGGREANPAPETSLLGRMRQRLCSDEELAAHLQRGNTDALALLFTRHSRLVFAITRRILGNDAEAEDAVQQVFLDVFRAIDQFDPEKGNFKTWLLLFAYHRTFNARRSLCTTHYFDTDPFEEAPPALLQRAEGAQLHSKAENRILVEQALVTLTARQRRTIELVYFSGLTALEVSAQTGESVRVVRHNLYRGLEKLRRFLCEPACSPSRTAKGWKQ
jgi:RNA polymerase sigma-70 factor, ECF subfamily